MLVKIHKSYREIVSICDKELLGKKFEEGIMQLDLTGEFYKGEEKSAPEVMEVIKNSAMEDATFNIVGEKSITCALKAGVISTEGLKRVLGIPVALVLL